MKQLQFWLADNFKALFEYLPPCDWNARTETPRHTRINLNLDLKFEIFIIVQINGNLNEKTIPFALHVFFVKLAINHNTS